MDQKIVWLYFFWLAFFCSNNDHRKKSNRIKSRYDGFG